MINTYHAPSLEAYPDICQNILSQAKHRIFLLEGDLGAGKTSMVQYFAAILGCKEKVNSPTYGIVNEYEANSQMVYHFDLYRLNNIEELLDIGIEEYLYSQSICFIEWPSLVIELGLETYHKIVIETINNLERKISFS